MTAYIHLTRNVLIVDKNVPVIQETSDGAELRES